LEPACVTVQGLSAVFVFGFNCCQIKSFIFNGHALGEWGARKHRKNPLKCWDEFSFKERVQTGTNKTEWGLVC
jgi:hypothetical protein